MKGQGTVRGILFTGNDGHEFLLGFTPREPIPTHVLSRRQGDGRFEPVADVQEASRLAVRQLGFGGGLIGPGTGQHAFLWSAFRAALAALPAPPSWPTSRP